MSYSRVFMVAFILLVGSIPVAGSAPAQASSWWRAGHVTAATVQASTPAHGLTGPDSAGVPRNVRVGNAGTILDEPYVVSDPRNPQDIVVGMNGDVSRQSGIDVAYSHDGGKSWHLSSLSTQGHGTPAVDPSLAFDRHGNVYFSCIAFTQGQGFNYIDVFKSSDDGVTWSIPTRVLPGDNYHNDRPFLTVDTTGGKYDGTVYVSWGRFLNNNQGQIWVARSTDGGHSFNSPVTLTPGWNDSYNGAVPAVAPDGSVYVVFYDFNNNQLDWVRSTDGGQTFTKPAVAANVVPAPNKLPHTQYLINSMPAFAISPKTGTLGIAWTDSRAGDLDIAWTHSTDGGATWSTPIRVNDDAISNGKDQFFPWVTVTPDGVWACVWLDRRRDPSNTSYDAYLSRSIVDGRPSNPGVHWLTNQRLTSVMSNPAATSSPGIGDYIGISADSQGGLHPVWTDLRRGRDDIETVVGVRE